MKRLLVYTAAWY